MIHTDVGFPVIEYSINDSPYEWGFKHGKQFSEPIKELVKIRTKLMLGRNPSLEPYIEPLALEQYEETRSFDENIAEELKGIAEGAGISISDAIILNNYTDFRDIYFEDEGCSTIYLGKSDQRLSGQTWDMHSSAKNYICVIKVPKTEHTEESIVFSLVGCLGMMGANSHKLFIGVNNLNTVDGRSGVIWPALVRKTLDTKSLDELRSTLLDAKITSAHNYLISSVQTGEHWEISPSKSILVKSVKEDESNSVFHTNHCLSSEFEGIENMNFVSATTHWRYELLEELTEDLNNFEDIYGLLTSHKNFPKSICSHFSTGSKDPSMTCGGGIFDHKTGKLRLWRGCPTHDKNYIDYNFTLGDN